MLEAIRTHYIEERLGDVDPDFLEFEENQARKEDLELIARVLSADTPPNNLPNPHNSILLYLTGLTDEFDFQKGRADTIGGSPPDIDIDFDTVDREKAIQWAVDHWGRDHVANIVTHGTFKPKSIFRSYYRVTEGDSNQLKEILQAIPKAKFGKEPNLKKVGEASPHIKSRYPKVWSHAEKLEDMVSHFGIHAAGIVISSEPIMNNIPVWSNKKSERITQYNKDEVEELGLLKFDYLGIDNLSILKEAVRLIEARHGIEIDLDHLPDGDPEAYRLITEGHFSGVFQMEGPGAVQARRMFSAIEPNSIEMISDVSALNRPGPLQAGLDREYVRNRQAGRPPEDLPEPVAKILEGTFWTLVYQEQVMELCSTLAGFSLKESDDIRRAMGRKDAKELARYHSQFLDGCKKVGLVSVDYANSLWVMLAGDPNDPSNNGFADYCLAWDTKVVTLEHGPLPIGFIVENRIEATVMSWTGVAWVGQPIAQWHDRGIRETSRYWLEDGSYVEATPDHRFLTADQQWLPIEEIFQQGLNLWVNDSPAKRETIGEQRVYDIGLDGHHNFLLENGLVAHNCFNKSHSACYSYLTYATSWLKAHYPRELFCALMSVRSRVMMPQDWATRAPDYVAEAAYLGVEVSAPCINNSGIGFQIKDSKILFGLEGIRDVGYKGARAIIRARRDTPFRDLLDFFRRVDLSRVNSKVFTALVHAGTFDSMGYRREDLLEVSRPMYDYIRGLVTYSEKIVAWQERENEIATNAPIIERLSELKRLSKRKTYTLDAEEEAFLEAHKGTRKKVSLKKPVEPQPPEMPDRYSRIGLSLEQIMVQAKYVGCYTGQHPAKLISVDHDNLIDAELGDRACYAGVVVKLKEITTRKGDKMAFMEIDDSTASCEVVIFPSVWRRIRKPCQGDLITLLGEVEEEEPLKLIANTVEVYRSIE